MKPFLQIAKPHDDIIQGNLTMDVFAADLWQVANMKAPEEYQNAGLFFSKTYTTKGLKNILDVAKARLEGKSGDSVVQLQTPFGGGKTHTLIALYHKAKKWNAKVVVFDGTALNPNEIKPWEELEKQLTGKIEITKGEIAPGKEKLIKIISEHSPVLILIDELLEYVTKAAGIKIGDSNLASQILAFIQELTGSASAVGNALVVLTLPSSILEHYDENAERMFQQLQKIIGRTEKIYTPVEDDEIEHVVRARLFSRINEKEIEKVVNEFVDYAKDEKLLSNDEIADYRQRFLRSYPFKPEVIDALYKKWGSFPTFQRTRGVLRLLSFVVRDLLDERIPFIRIGDFNLNNDEIKRELIKHIGQEWESIIAQDITSNIAGTKKIDESLQSAYKPYKLGTTVATTIFMLSFSGKGSQECSVSEIKLATVYPEFSSAVIDTVISNLKDRLFYISDEGLFFTNQPNLNRIIIAREESITNENIYEEHKKIIETHTSRDRKFKIYTHPKFSRDIQDTPELKLIVLDKNAPETEFLEKYGESPRIYRNTMIFLCVDETQRESFHKYIKRILALKSIENDKRLNLTENQKKEVKNKVENYKRREYDELRKFYRKLYLPSKEGFKLIDIGIATLGEEHIDKEVYEILKSQEKVVEKLAPKAILDKYFLGRDYIEIKKLYEAFLKTPGEIRLFSKETFLESIREGVKNGLFGFGYIGDGNIECKCINQTPDISLTDNEVIIRPELCAKDEEDKDNKPAHPFYPSKVDDGTKPAVKEPGQDTEEAAETKKEYSKINLKLNVPDSQISTVARIVNFLKSKFNQCKIKIEIDVTDGNLQITEYEDKIKEALAQAGIEIEEEYKNQ